MDKEVEEVIKRLQQETPDPLEEVMTELTEDTSNGDQDKTQVDKRL